jgi:hypothetical protein
LGHIHRHRYANIRAIHQGIDADQPALRIDHRATGMAGA